MTDAEKRKHLERMRNEMIRNLKENLANPKPFDDRREQRWQRSRPVDFGRPPVPIPDHLMVPPRKPKPEGGPDGKA